MHQAGRPRAGKAGKAGEGFRRAVYLANDTKLRRKVAIKVLPEEVPEDADRLARFEREARSLAALNHQNIAQIHEVGELAAVVRRAGVDLGPGARPSCHITQATDILGHRLAG